RRLAGDTDTDQRVQDTHDGAEQTDERRDRTDRTQEGDAALQTGIGVFQLAGQGHADPIVQADQGGATGGGLEAGFGDAAEHGGLGQLVYAFVQGGGGPELLLDLRSLAQDALLLDPLGEEDVPGAGRHDRQND